MWHYFILVSIVLSTIISGTTVLANTVCTPKCSDLSIPINVSSPVRQFPASFNISQFNLTTAPDLPPASIPGRYIIAASYCEPTIEDQNVDGTLQILIHGSYYTRSYWSGLKTPPQSINGTEYSWIDYASSHGFATLAIDRLCNGKSSHPNEPQACQIENQVAILNQLIINAREGRYGGKTYSRVILVGHSFGSLLIQAFTHEHPHVVDEVVLTGFSGIILQGFQAVASSGGFNGAFTNHMNPPKHRSLDSSYLSMTNETTFINSFYFGAFNTPLAEYNFELSGTFNIFEAATSAFGQSPASNYTGSVIVLNGEDDAAVCSGNCGQGSTSITEEVKSLYPSARTFLWHNTANTGHCLSLHFTAQDSYSVIFNDLM